MPQCQGRTRAGTQCTRMVPDGQTVCWQHANHLPLNGRLAEDDVFRLDVALQELADLQDERMAAPSHPTTLGRMAESAQNSHAGVLTRRLRSTIQTILALHPRDEPYAPTISALTSMMTGCTHSTHSIRNLTTLYTTFEPFDGFEANIVPRLLEAIWNYTIHSPHTEDIRNCFVEDLERGYQMCLRGNIARLCTTLQGFAEFTLDVRSTTEVLGDSLAALRSSSDPFPKILEDAIVILDELDIEPDQWRTWLEPFVADEQDDAYLTARIGPT